VIPSSLRARVAIGALVVVAAVLIGGGFAIVRLTEQRDRRDADGELRRVAGNLMPELAGSFGIVPPGAWTHANVPVQFLDGQGHSLLNEQPPPGAGPPPLPGPAVIQPLRDSFAASGDMASPVGQIGFARAVAPDGRRLVVGVVPPGFPAMPRRARARTVPIGDASWRSVVVRGPGGLLVEIAARERISARAASLRDIVIWTSAAGLVIALLATLLVTRLALRPLELLRRRTAQIAGAEDLGVRVREPGQPTEVASLAGELDGMLERLQDATAAREQALLAARRFAADAGHELRTPLQSIRSNLDIARSPEANEAEHSHALDVAMQQSERMKRLVDGLQSLARGESGPSEQTAEIDLGDIADGAVFVTRTRHPELTIAVDLPQSGPIVTGDGDGLWRVVENLLENAARHGRAGGHVNLRVGSLDGGAEIVVDDDGPGIPSAERERVMRRFQRGPGAAAAGSGLGLAIVEAEARRHGGSLSLDTSSLGGLRARVSINTD
jgi:two-component system, OmpR family, sensor histidine kinase PrrB